MFVIDAFLHKASLISWILWLVDWGCLLDRLLLLFLDEANLSWKGLIHFDVLVLADELGWGEFRLSNFEHGVTSMDSVALTVLANVVIGADGAHIADSLDWCHITAIANKVLMEHVGLFNALPFEEILEHVLEGLVTVFTNFTFNGGGNLCEFFG
jgi:hypothetical protein